MKKFNWAREGLHLHDFATCEFRAGNTGFQKKCAASQISNIFPIYSMMAGKVKCCKILTKNILA